MVAQNKSLPGRGDIVEGEAVGRYLSVAWFELVPDPPDSILATDDDCVVVRSVAGAAGPGAITNIGLSSRNALMVYG